jgi:hypothetical protein
VRIGPRNGIVAVAEAASKVEGNTGICAKGEQVSDRVHSGRYRPLPVRRTYIPKADGGQRPLGIVAREDKIVQSAACTRLASPNGLIK